MSRRVALNATAYDALPSGARERAVGLAAGLLQEGADVALYAPRGLRLTPFVEHELGDAGARGRLTEVETPLESTRPVRRALQSAAWFEGHVADADLFLTDYYPVLRRVPTAVTIHDLRYLVAPDDEPLSRVVWFRAFYPARARRAPLVVVPSGAIREQVVERLGVAAARVAVVQNGLPRAWREAPASPVSPEHFLMIGAAEARKNARMAVAALAQLDAPPVLKIVGRAGAPLPADGAVVEHCGVVSDEVLVQLCRGAHALLHPSRYEGFGMPVIQALAVGVPVLAGECAAVAEVADGGAELLPPDDVTAWTAALQRARSETVRPTPAAIARARSFTWRAAARTLLDALDALDATGC